MRASYQRRRIQACGRGRRRGKAEQAGVCGRPHLSPPVHVDIGWVDVAVCGIHIAANCAAGAHGWAFSACGWCHGGACAGLALPHSGWAAMHVGSACWVGCMRHGMQMALPPTIFPVVVVAQVVNAGIQVGPSGGRIGHLQRGLNR